MINTELLQKAEIEIEKEMNEHRFICDSDCAERFLDELVNNLISEDSEEYENERDELLAEIKSKIMIKYNKFATCDERANYACCYYKDDVKFEDWDEFNKYFGIYFE